MPTIEVSGIRLEYSDADDVRFRDGAIKLRAKVQPFNINNRVWFVFRIDSREWQRKRADWVPDESQDEYRIELSLSEVAGRLTYYAYVRRGPLTTPRWAGEVRGPDSAEVGNLAVEVALPSAKRSCSDVPAHSNREACTSGLGFADGNRQIGARGRLVKDAANRWPPRGFW